MIEKEVKENRYELLLKQIPALIEGETDETAVTANVCAVLAETFPEWLWIGFYRVVDGELLLGAFQGPVACYHIKKGRGVCGTSWDRDETLVVANVEEFPGHIACSSLSRSEIVVPVHNKTGAVVAVLDIDSPELSTFDAQDKCYLEQIVTIVEDGIYK